MEQRTTTQPNNATTTAKFLERPPIVVIMGHVDHGKTSLLDYIRKTNLAEKEAGGITQSIGAYEISHNGKKITFIDTPGHEAFSQMRARGADIADLAVLIVAADDGVQPQTKESIKILQESKTPFVVAINKIDKPNADVEKTKNDLMQNGVYLEGLGGNISWQKIAAKKGEGVEELLDLILLAAEMEQLSFDPEQSAEGFILEAKKDNFKGITASVIVKNGTLKTGDYIATQTSCGKIKMLEDFRGKKADSLEPSAPALVLGFSELPAIGENFIAGKIEPEITRIASAVENGVPVAAENGKKCFNLILKADVSGSLEALSLILKNLPQGESPILIVDEKIGEISDNDVKLAISTGACIVGFKSKVNKSAENLARVNNVSIITSEIIYDLIKNVEDKVEGTAENPILGQLEILAIFNQNKTKQTIGGRVTEGTIKSKTRLKIIREEQEIGWGKVVNLQKGRSDTSEVKAGEECGLIFESETPIQKGDWLFYENLKS